MTIPNLPYRQFWFRIAAALTCIYNQDLTALSWINYILLLSDIYVTMSLSQKGVNIGLFQDRPLRYSLIILVGEHSISFKHHMTYFTTKRVYLSLDISLQNLLQMIRVGPYIINYNRQREREKFFYETTKTATSLGNSRLCKGLSTENMAGQNELASSWIKKVFMNLFASSQSPLEQIFPVKGLRLPLAI